MSVIDYEVQTPAGPETRPVPVTIVNTEDLLTPYTPPSVVEQTSPETFAAQSWLLTVANPVAQILQLSPLRQSALISMTAAAPANVRICHSLQSAQDVAKNGVNSNGGMPVTAPLGPFPVGATGGLWAVLETTGSVNVGVLSQERQR